MHFHSALLIQHPHPPVNPKRGSVGGEPLQLFLLAGSSLDVPFCYGQQHIVVLGLGGCIIHVCPLDFDNCGICLKAGNYLAAHSLCTLLYKKVLKWELECAMQFILFGFSGYDLSMRAEVLFFFLVLKVPILKSFFPRKSFDLVLAFLIMVMEIF